MTTPRYCWDTSVFLAWIGSESTAPLADIELVLNGIHSGSAILMVSVMTFAEILEAKHTPEQLEAFKRFMLRSNVQRLDASFRIAQKAEQIRSRGITDCPTGQERRIKTVDATIIATAILYKADVLHSLEPKHRALSGSEIVDGLRIESPCLLNHQRAIGFPVNARGFDL